MTVLNVRRLLLLREVEARGSIAAAAQALNYTRSAVSQQLSVLEEETGRTLLTRDGQRAGLTAAGHLLVRHAERVIAQLETAEVELHSQEGEVTGDLRVGVPLHEGPALVAPAATRLRTEYPKLRITLHGVTSDGGRDDVRLGRLDVALAARYTYVPTERRTGLHEEELISDDIRLAVAPGHPFAASGESRTVEEFSDSEWLLDRATDLGRLGLHLCAGAGFQPEVVCDTGDLQAVLGLVSLGWGVALVPDLVPDRPNHPVVRLALRGHRLTRRITLVVREGVLNSPPTAALLSSLREAAGHLAHPGHSESSG
ncbi:LysR family transcriptional regulator [Streptomyces sp. NPDC046716]|uniref:LysR family transcriptional regulator n=1 Tax=Streptomyces sp. NPDC046716 TaxID=3157093 RepID=UPI00340CA76D